jgi:hypothetical protein
MRRVVIVAALAAASVGCATPIILEHPSTRQRVDCTREAERLVYDAPPVSLGTDVPWPLRGSPMVRAYDLEQQCTGELLREGYVCVSGCTTPPQ